MLLIRNGQYLEFEGTLTEFLATSLPSKGWIIADPVEVTVDLDTLKAQKHAFIKDSYESLMSKTDYHFIKKLELPTYEIPQTVLDDRLALRIRWFNFESALHEASTAEAIAGLGL